jgi:hypothetical protein
MLGIGGRPGGAPPKHSGDVAGLPGVVTFTVAPEWSVVRLPDNAHILKIDLGSGRTTR